jgi:hypothetical protein
MKGKERIFAENNQHKELSRHLIFFFADPVIISGRSASNGNVTGE